MNDWLVTRHQSRSLPVEEKQCLNVNECSFSPLKGTENKSGRDSKYPLILYSCHPYYHLKNNRYKCRPVRNMLIFSVELLAFVYWCIT